MILKTRMSLMKELESLPGIGAILAQELWSIGIRSIKDLKNRNPDDIYHIYQNKRGGKSDKSMLYILRCAAYFASNSEHDPELLKWWNWKEKKEESTPTALRW